jgi:hypothetical protein
MKGSPRTVAALVSAQVLLGALGRDDEDERRFLLKGE